MLKIRGYYANDEAQLLGVWNAALPQDLVDASSFRRKVLLDPNFDPHWLLVAEMDGRLAGFCVCIVRRTPVDRVAQDAGPETFLELDRGWITAFGVAPEFRRQGVGQALLDCALNLFRQAERRQVLIAPYTPNYFVPGVDEVNYAEGLRFLVRRGFEVISRPLSMDANIVLFDYSPYEHREVRLREQGIQICSLRADEMPLLLSFLSAHAPPDWLRDARELLVDVTRGLATEEQFTVAVFDGQVVGYCQFRGEHFGPFGVRKDWRGRGIGTVLLARSLLTMKRKCLHHAWVLWTSDETADRLYKKLGFAETRRFAVLRKML